MGVLFCIKFDWQTQMIGRVIFDLSFRLHFILIRCCLPENIYKKIEHLNQSSSERDLIKWDRTLMFTCYDFVPRFCLQIKKV